MEFLELKQIRFEQRNGVYCALENGIIYINPKKITNMQSLNGGWERYSRINISAGAIDVDATIDQLKAMMDASFIKTIKIP